MTGSDNVMTLVALRYGGVIGTLLAYSRPLIFSDNEYATNEYGGQYSTVLRFSPSKGILKVSSSVNTGEQIANYGVNTTTGGSLAYQSSTMNVLGTNTITNKAAASNVATLTTATAHGFIAGQSVVISGVDATFDGTYTILNVFSTTTFTYTLAATVSSTAATGTVVVNLNNFVLNFS